MNLVPEWTGLVVSGTGNADATQEGAGQLSDFDFRNALLYCDKVFWLPQEYISARISNSVVDGLGKLLDGTFQRLVALERRTEKLKSILAPAGNSPAGMEVANLVTPTPEWSTLKEDFDRLLHSHRPIEGAMANAIADLTNAGLNSSYQLLIPDNSFYDHLSFSDHLKPTLPMPSQLSYTVQCPDPDLVIIPSASAKQLGWMKTAIAQQSLAISRLYLPDVAQLPFEAIAEMRDHLRPYLNPMRAELLRLTEDLRKMARDTADASEVATEAEYLVRVRVEPLMREVGQRAEEIMKKKWRRLFQGVVKVFGLTGAALFKPDLLKDALKEVLDTGGALAERNENTEAMSDTAHFVLEARRCILERSGG